MAPSEEHEQEKGEFIASGRVAINKKNGSRLAAGLT
jgi:hypothetical protein